MAVLLAAIIGSMFLIGCPDETGTRNGGGGTGTGENWTERPIGATGGINAVHYANNRWVAVGSNSTATGGTITTGAANDGLWVTISGRGGFGTILTDIHYANNLWVAVGTDGTGSTTTGTITTSTNGTAWTAQTSNVSGALTDIHYANNLWVAVGSVQNAGVTTGGAITTSANGTAWTAQTSNVSSNLQDIHHANGLWVAVGEKGAITTSTNGTAWTAQTSNVNAILNAIHYATDENGNNGLWVAVGHRLDIGNMDRPTGTIITSTNGTDWTTRTSNVSGALLDIHYAKGLWVTISTDGETITSADGATWTVQTSNVSGELNDIHYANGLWVAVGGNETTNSNTGEFESADTSITTSTNGTTWTAQTSNVTNGWLSAIHYANGLWVAVGIKVTTDSMGINTETGAITTAP